MKTSIIQLKTIFINGYLSGKHNILKKLLKLFLIFILCASSANVLAQSDSINLISNDFNIDSLKKIYGKHKHLLKEYEVVSLIALSYYPELLNEHIKFKFSSINSTERATVTFGSVFKKIDKQYIICINDDIERTGMLLSQAPFYARVALIGHELAHILDFKSRGFLEMAWWGLSYMFTKHRTKIEKIADKTSIKHGLGRQLYHWANFVLNHSTANKHYLKMKDSKYLLPDEILRYMKEYNLQ